MGKIKITCEEAATICTKSQYGAASLVDKIKLSIHFIFCKVCRLYSKQNTALSSMCESAKKHKETSSCCLSDEDKAKLKAQIKEFDKAE